MADNATMNKSTENGTSEKSTPKKTVAESNQIQDTNETGNSSKNPAPGKISVVNVKTLQNPDLSSSQTSQQATAETVTAKDNTQKDKPEETEGKKVLEFGKLNKTVTPDDIRKILKEHTNDDICNDVEGLYKKFDMSGLICVVKFKSAEKAAEAKSMLEKVKLRKPFYTIGWKVENVTKKKRPATKDVAPVPGKVQKVETVTKAAKEEKRKTLVRTLFLNHVPLTWTKEDIKQFIKQETLHLPGVLDGVQYIYLENVAHTGEFNGRCHVLFDNTLHCRDAFYNLIKADRIFNGVKMTVDYEYPDSKFAVVWLPNNHIDVPATRQRQMQREMKQAENHQKKFIPKKPNLNQHINNDNQNPSQEVGNFHTNPLFVNQNVNINDTFGISIQYLETHGIKPPLTTKICVDNLSVKYDDEIMIRKLFSHAGTVVDVVFIFRCAEKLVVKVNYDHPVEAIQAISMFNNQEIYGQTLVVTMDQSHSAYKTYFPKGVQCFGPGLCPDGTVMKNIRNTIELQRAVNMILKQMESLKRTIEGLQQGLQQTNEQLQNLSVTLAKQAEVSAATNAQNHLAIANNQTSAPNNPLLAFNALLTPQAMQLLQLLQQPTAGNVLNPALTQLVTAQNPQPQEVTWSNNPVNVLNNAGIAPAANIQGAPNMQQQFGQDGQLIQGNIQGGISQGAGPVSSGGQYPHGAPNAPMGQNVPAGQFGQGGPNMSSGQFGQSVQNMPTGQFGQGGQNIATVQYGQGGPNMPSGQFPQGGQNMPTGQLAQVGPNNMSSGQFGQNMPTGQFGQGVSNAGPFGQNEPIGQFVQGGPNMATAQFGRGQNMPGGQFGQGGPNTPSEQFSKGGPNMPGGQFGQGGPNTPSEQFSKGGLNMPGGQFGQGGPNTPSDQFSKGGPNMPGGQFQGGPNSSFNQNPSTPQPPQLAGAPRIHDPCTVEFSYLPPSVTLAALQSKMHEVGDLRSSKMTGPGRALVTFHSPRDANACIKLLHLTKVDGQTIEVKNY